MKYPIEELIGRTFGKLTILSEAEVRVSYNPKRKYPQRMRMMNCICECGAKAVFQLSHLIQGVSNSCGCYRKKYLSVAKKRHGGSSTALYRTYSNMIQRCGNSKNNAFKHYGGRGINVCAEWLAGFGAFEKWALASGYAPGLTIDRIDPDGNYEPSNCRWVTFGENIAARNANYFSKKRAVL